MSALSIQVPFPVFQDRDGQPLENGYIWLGVANLNPQTNPVIAYYDEALTIPAPQPLRTLNGYISRAGTPAKVYVDGVNFSILVQDSKGSMVYNFPDGTGVSADSCGIEYDPPFTGSVPTTVCLKLAQIVSVKDFGAVGNGVVDDSAAIQAAIDAVNTGGGGKIYFPQGKYNIGTTGLVVYQNIVLCGEVTRYGGSTTRGVSLIYTGSADAIFGENLLDVQILDLDIDCTGSTGTYPTGRGIYLNGCWKSTLRNVTVRGLTLAKGYAIAIDTNPDAFGPPSPANAWGAQHNYLEQIEVADGTILFVGTGASDGVTTTVCNTIRGYQYEIASSQIVFINSTAEGWSTGIGFNFYGAGCYGLMLGCDIEGSGSPGIQTDGFAEVREMGTIWAGFSGAVRVNGYMASVRSYGGAFEWNADLTVGVPAQLMLAGNKNVSNFVSEFLYPVNVSGGTQDGYRLWKRRNTGVDIVDHDWQQHAFVQKAISTSVTSAVTIFTIPVPSGGLKVSAHAQGIQAGDGAYSIARDCVVSNNAGTLTVLQNTQLTAGAANAISFTASGTNLLVQITPTTVNASTGNMNLEIRGPWTSYI
jgi:hypothetical protein